MALRKIEIIPNFAKNSDGSVLIRCEGTEIVCTANLSCEVPMWLKNSESGWLSAEYNMLPGSTIPRKNRERSKVSGRTYEIQRLIGRSLRNSVNLDKLTGCSLVVDCDVINADGGTRCASITGGAVAVYLALKKHNLAKTVWHQKVAAVSVGILNNKMYLDLDYELDYKAEVDLNLVLLESGQIVEIQGTSEKIPFSKVTLINLIDLAEKGIKEIFKIQSEFIN